MSVSDATIKAQNISVISDANGYFTIITNDSVKISAAGFQPQNILLSSSVDIVFLTPVINEIDAVFVTANRGSSVRKESPMAISKLSAKTIDETKANSLFEIVNKTSGVMMVNLNNEQHAMSIRQPLGFSSYYLYMEDGLAIRPMGVFNHNALLETNQFAIETIEVVKGPASSLYGPEAIGGTVNIISQGPTALPSAKLGIQFDQWGFKRIQFGTGARIKKFGFYIGGLTSQQTNSWLNNSNFNKEIVNLKLEYAFSSKTRLIGTSMYGNYYSNTSGAVDSAAFLIELTLV